MTQHSGDTAVGGPGSSPSVEPASGGLDASHSIPIATPGPAPFKVGDRVFVGARDFARVATVTECRWYTTTAPGIAPYWLVKAAHEFVTHSGNAKAFTPARVCDHCHGVGFVPANVARGIETRSAETGSAADGFGPKDESPAPEGTRP